MDWIKRNLYFVIGTAVAVILLGLAGFYLYSKWDLNNKNLDQLNEAYEKLKNLAQQNPHPGSGNVNNIETAKEQQKELKGFIQKTRTYFQKIPAIPDVPKIKDQDFSEALSRSISQLRQAATNASVGLPPDYGFSFDAERRKVVFDQTTLPLMAIQLGEVKAICDVLIRAKINALDSLRRERVSTDDAAGNQTDYLTVPSLTNELAVLSPYEVSFKCFSPELAGVLGGFASSPYGFLIKNIAVEPGAPLVTDTTTATPVPVAPVMPVYTPQPVVPNRYGADGGRYGGDGEYRPGYPRPAPVQQPIAVAPVAPRPTGLQTVLDEKQLKVTLLVEVVKLLPPAK